MSATLQLRGRMEFLVRWLHYSGQQPMLLSFIASLSTYHASSPSWPSLQPPLKLALPLPRPAEPPLSCASQPLLPLCEHLSPSRCAASLDLRWLS